jgi:alpha-beta hydrolase superfamily lysophospholipase
VVPTARVQFDEAVGRCLAEPSVLVLALGAVALGDQVFSRELTSGPLLERLRENVPTLPIGVPLLLAQGEVDQLVLPSVQADYVAARCEAGQAIDYRTYPGLDHVPLVEPDSALIPELFEWTQARFDGAEPTPTC